MNYPRIEEWIARQEPRPLFTVRPVVRDRTMTRTEWYELHQKVRVIGRLVRHMESLGYSMVLRSLLDTLIWGTGPVVVEGHADVPRGTSEPKA